MKLFQYISKGETCTGILLNGQPIDLQATVQAAGANLPYTMKAIVESGIPSAELEASYRALFPVVMNEPIEYAACADHPEKILCVGLNYMAHQAETNLRNQASFPPLFCKFANSLTGHDHVIHLPACANRFDYEV